MALSHRFNIWVQTDALTSLLVGLVVSSTLPESQFSVFHVSPCCMALDTDNFDILYAYIVDHTRCYTWA